MTSRLPVTRHDDVRLLPDASRVISKPFLPGEEILPDGSRRIDVVVGRVFTMSDHDVATTLESTMAGFADRHPAFETTLDENYARVAQRVRFPEGLSSDRRKLIGAYFTHEYSIEAAALGNPSIVAHPDQSSLAAGETRFVMSLRAIGEGHISSVGFRSGVLGTDLSITLDRPSQHAITGRTAAIEYDRSFFIRKLKELETPDEGIEIAVAKLGPSFTLEELEESLRAPDRGGTELAIAAETAHIMHWLVMSNYRTEFPSDSDISERTLFPAGPTESRGMEDVRLVRFVNQDDTVTYYGTYTAYDGHRILPQMIETADFESFRIWTLGGQCAQNKGIALFPRKLAGEFVALGRHDNVNNFVMKSEDIRIWRETDRIQEPERPWELMQLGNCGSPIETEAGWLVITHGVGPMRRYTIGALLLDLHDPARVIGHLKEPLLEPLDDEREGYVPNVVYSCGSMIHRDHLVLPYGFADVGASIATVPLDDLLDRLVHNHSL